MARPGVTYFDVSRAAQQLTAAGKTPTIDAIRIALGSTGSNGTIGTHLRAWKAKQDQDQQIASKEKLPEVLVATMRGLWELVMNQSEEQIQVIRQRSQQDLTQIKQEFQRLQLDNTKWQQQHQQLKEERDGLSNEKLSLEQLLINAKIEMATATEKHAGLEQQLKEKQTRIDELRRQNQQIQSNLEHYREASAEQRQIEQQRYEQQIKQLDQTIMQANQELVDTRKEKTEVQQQYQQAIYDRENLKTQLNKFERQNELANKELTGALSKLASSNQSQQHWREQYHTLLTKWEEQNKLLLERQTQYALLLQQTETTKSELAEMHKQNKYFIEIKENLNLDTGKIQ